MAESRWPDPTEDDEFDSRVCRDCGQAVSYCGCIMQDYWDDEVSEVDDYGVGMYD